MGINKILKKINSTPFLFGGCIGLAFLVFLYITGLLIPTGDMGNICGWILGGLAFPVFFILSAIYSGGGILDQIVAVLIFAIYYFLFGGIIFHFLEKKLISRIPMSKILNLNLYTVVHGSFFAAK